MNEERSEEIYKPVRGNLLSFTTHFANRLLLSKLLEECGCAVEGNQSLHFIHNFKCLMLGRGMSLDSAPAGLRPALCMQFANFQPFRRILF